MIDFGVRVVTVILGKRRINVERQRGKKKKKPATGCDWRTMTHLRLLI